MGSLLTVGSRWLVLFPCERDTGGSRVKSSDDPTRLTGPPCFSDRVGQDSVSFFSSLTLC